MTVFEWIVVVELGVSLALLIYIAMALGPIGHLLMNIEETLKRAAVEAKLQWLADKK